MVNKGLTIVIGIAAIIAVAWASRAEAAGEFVCPYDGQIFPTLSALQDHVLTVHPGERIPISIKWS